MEITRISELSAGKFAASFFAFLALLPATYFSVISSISRSQLEADLGRYLIGVGVILWAPLISGIVGFFFGAICATFYNICASARGGIEVEIRECQS